MPEQVSQSADVAPGEQEAVAVAQEYQPGELTPAIVTSQQVWKPADIEQLLADLWDALEAIEPPSAEGGLF